MNKHWRTSLTSCWLGILLVSIGGPTLQPPLPTQQTGLAVHVPLRQKQFIFVKIKPASRITERRLTIPNGESLPKRLRQTPHHTSPFA